MSLLELVIATSMLTMVMTSIAVVLRTGRQSWEAHEGDYIRIEAAHATVRHIVREIRQGEAVTAISPANDNSGRLSVRMPGGDIKSWDHDANTNRVNFGVNVGTPQDLLAPNIVGLRFVGLKANGTTATVVPDEVQCLRIELTVQLPRAVAGTRVVHSWVWVRSW